MKQELIKKDSTALIPVGNLNTYITAVYGIPALGAEEERQLAIEYRENNDLNAARKLTLHNLRFVIHVARSYAGYGLALEDLIQEGNIGLMKALKRFNPALGVRLVSFAVHWIRAEIHEFIIKNWRIVKIATTKGQRKLFFNLRNSKKRLGWLNPAEVERIAEDLGVKPAEVIEMEKRMGHNEVSFDPLPEDDKEEAFAPSEWLTDEKQITDPAKLAEQEQWKEHYHEKLMVAMQELDQRSRDILKARWLSDGKKTLDKLGKQYKVSPERIRQIEKRALEKLKESISDEQPSSPPSERR